MIPCWGVQLPAFLFSKNEEIERVNTKSRPSDCSSNLYDWLTSKKKKNRSWTE